MQEKKDTRKQNQEDYLERMKEQKKLRQEIINFFKEKEVTYEQAINILKDTLYRLERMSLNQKL